MTENEIWGGDSNFRLFISHVSTYKEQAHKIKSGTENFGIYCFVAHDDIKPDFEWQNVMLTALSTCHGLLSLFTPGFHQSEWTDQEIGFVLGKEKPIIPVMIDQTPPYGFIGKKQGLKYNDATINSQIASILIGTNERMVDALISKIEQSRSYDESDLLASILEKAIEINDSQAELLVKAFKKNDQVRSTGFHGGSWYGNSYIGLEKILRNTNNPSRAEALSEFIKKCEELNSE